MDFDPRWTDDSRGRDDRGRELSQGSRGGSSDPRERDGSMPRDVFTQDLELPAAMNANGYEPETTKSGCAAPRSARWRPSELSASSLPATCETATGVLFGMRMALTLPVMER